MTYTVTLHNAQQAHQVLAKLWAWVKPRLIAGHRLQLSIAEEGRSADQNKMLHAMLGDIALNREWAGRKWDAEVWKRLLTAAWSRANGEHSIVVPALDGHGVDVVFRRTSKLSRAECSDLIDFIAAWSAVPASGSNNAR